LAKNTSEKITLLRIDASGGKEVKEAEKRPETLTQEEGWVASTPIEGREKDDAGKSKGCWVNPGEHQQSELKESKRRMDFSRKKH